MNWKYIMTDMWPILFAETFQHKDIANNHWKIESAWFFFIELDEKEKRWFKVKVWGESVSLNIKSKESDSEQIKSLLLWIPLYLM